MRRPLGMRSVVVFGVVFFGLLVSLASGCANWNQDGGQTRQFNFPETRLPKDAVALEIGVAQLDHAQLVELEAFWAQLDQQTLPLAKRQQLDQNGLRVAVMSTRAPGLFNQLLQPALPDVKALGPFGRHLASQNKLQPVSRLLVHQRISNRAGQSHPVVTSDVQPRLTCTLRGSDGPQITTADNAAGFFEVTTFPNPDGSVRLAVAPKLRQGENRRRFGVAEGSFILDQGQATTDFDMLNFELELGVGETMLVAANPQNNSNTTADLAGTALFHINVPKTDKTATPESGDNRQLASGSPQRVLLVRLVQTQMDDLFERAKSADKLTTTHDW